MQVIYGVISDSGDGSSHLKWFRDKRIVDAILDHDALQEQFYANEGSPSEIFSFPDDLDLVMCGFNFDDESFIEYL